MILTIIIVVLILLVIAGFGLYIFYQRTNPSLKRNWSPDQAIMPSIHFLDAVGITDEDSPSEGSSGENNLSGAKDKTKNKNKKNRVRINNIRDINYRTTRDFDLQFYDRTIDLNDVESAWLVISPFGSFGVAHTFVSFGLKDGTFLSISIEVRRKKSQKFSAVKGFLNQFEMMYVIADESDVIKVRTNVIKATVRLFPIQTEKKRVQAVFLDMLKRADNLGKEPEFYNTIWNNCTTNIIMHTRKFSDKSIPFWDLRYLFPENIDKIAYDLNMLDTHLSYADAREHFDISEIAQLCAFRGL
jgi:hypothetical protein